jgi:glycosyltransferase involved in cell wall biosynthesis
MADASRAGARRASSPGRLTVAVDAREIYSAGVGRYLREILSVLAEDGRFGDLLLLGDPDTVEGYRAEVPTIRTSVVRYPGRFYSPRSQAAWPRARRAARNADVWFFPHYDVPLVGLPRSSVVTIHDLTHFRVPEAFEAWRRAAAGLLMRRAAEQAGRIITGSENARCDVVARYPVAAGKIEVIPHGVSDCFTPRPPEERRSGRGVANLSPYLLCVGNRKPHKNLVAAVEALALLQPEWPEVRLVCAGRAYRGWDEVRARAEALGIADALVEVDNPDDELLRDLYRGCEALLFPSLYEGYGLPVIEAMACGAPVVASDRASVPEVAGGAAVLIDPLDHAAIADAVRRIRRSPELREELVSRGLERAAALRWASAGGRTVDLLASMATGIPGRTGRTEAAAGSRARVPLGASSTGTGGSSGGRTLR